MQSAVIKPRALPSVCHKSGAEGRTTPPCRPVLPLDLQARRTARIPSAKPLFSPSATPDMPSLLLAASLLAAQSLAAIIYDPTLVANKTYDFIIAGVSLLPRSLLVSIPIPSSNVFPYLE